MLEDVKTIISKDFETIVSGSLSLLLLNCYSKLYLNGGQPAYCRASQQKYYNEILKTGLKMAENYDSIKKRTLILKNKTGLMYVGKPFCRHFNLELLTDEEAISLLKAGWMNPSQFEKLPENPLNIQADNTSKVILSKPKKGSKKAPKN